MKIPQYIFILFFMELTTSMAQEYASAPKLGWYTDQWVATDGMGRELPTFSEVGPLKKDRKVGVFYYIWQGFHGDTVHDITQILKEPKEKRQWGKKGEFHFWGEPEQGYYRAADPWVIRRDLQMLTNARVDFIFIDVTNAVVYPEEVHTLLKIGNQMRFEGIPTPYISFCTNSKSGQTMNAVYDEYYTNEKYGDQWFQWDGKPLILGQKNDILLREEVKNFFTIKYSWAWTDTDKKPNHWQWLDRYPQNWGWSKNPQVPEQITVSTAHHPSNPLGKSYHEGKEPPVNLDYTTEFTKEGLQFQEQWFRALKVDPEVIMVTQWNEWIAQRFIWDTGSGSYGGRSIADGDSYFVDVFSMEFNRDIAPMKDGYTDNYYYQLISNIRKYKGMEAPQKPSQPNPIFIDGDFEDWKNVTPYFQDPRGDTMHRDFMGYDKMVRYINKTGRNDIVGSKVGIDKENLLFYAETSDDISPAPNLGWMLLLIDIDKDMTTGWEGYDFIVNQSISSDEVSTIKKWDGDHWGKSSPINLHVVGRALELAIPKKILAIKDDTIDLYFKWADNPGKLTDITTFFMNGDTAPDRRAKFHFIKE